MDSNQETLNKICDEIRDAYSFGWCGFHEDDVPVFLEYGYIPLGKEHEGIYNEDEYEIKIEHDLVKSNEISLLNGNRKEILDRTYIKLLREYSPRITKYSTRQFKIYTCEEAFRKGYSKELQEIIEDLKNPGKRKIF